MLEFKRKKIAEEKAKRRTEMCDDVTKLQKLRVPELNEYLKHHGLKQHLKSSKSEKAKAIDRRSCLEQKIPLTAGQPTLRNARTLT